MNPKCKICGKELDRNTAYKVVLHRKNYYYCSEEEYLLYLSDEQKREESLSELYEVMQHTSETVSDSSLRTIKDVVDELVKKYPQQQVLDYLKRSSSHIHGILSRKTFTSDSNKIKYYAAIVKNHIGEYIDFKVAAEPVEVDFYFAPNNYKPSKIRRAMVDIEQMEDNDVDE